MKPPISEVLRAAASVRGARSLAVETAASKAAPGLLAAAEAALQGIAAQATAMEPTAPSQARELAWERACSIAAEYRAAVDELRAALGLETHAESMAREGSAREVEETAREAEETADTEWAKDFARALKETADRYCGTPYDQFGQRVALITTTRYATVSDGRDGWELSEAAKETVATAEDGRVLASGEFVTVKGDGDRVAYGDRLNTAGLNGAPKTPATSEWLPVPAKRPRQYKGDFDAEKAWEEAFRAQKGAALAPAPIPETKEFKNSPFAGLRLKG